MGPGFSHEWMKLAQLFCQVISFRCRHYRWGFAADSWCSTDTVMMTVCLCFVQLSKFSVTEIISWSNPVGSGSMLNFQPPVTSRETPVEIYLKIGVNQYEFKCHGLHGCLPTGCCWWREVFLPRASGVISFGQSHHYLEFDCWNASVAFSLTLCVCQVQYFRALRMWQCGHAPIHWRQVTSDK